MRIIVLVCIIQLLSRVTRAKIVVGSLETHKVSVMKCLFVRMRSIFALKATSGNVRSIHLVALLINMYISFILQLHLFR